MVALLLEPVVILRDVFYSEHSLQREKGRNRSPWARTQFEACFQALSPTMYKKYSHQTKDQSSLFPFSTLIFISRSNNSRMNEDFGHYFQDGYLTGVCKETTSAVSGKHLGDSREYR